MKKKRTAGGWKSRRANFNKPPDGESWRWLTQEMLESSAWRAMSFAARKIIDRLIVEHLAHAGTENGNLISTYSDFEKFEIRAAGVLPRAIVAAETLGFIDVIKRGGSAYADLRFPSIYFAGMAFPAKTAQHRTTVGRHSRQEPRPVRPFAAP